MRINWHSAVLAVVLACTGLVRADDPPAAAPAPPAAPAAPVAPAAPAQPEAVEAAPDAGVPGLPEANEPLFTVVPRVLQNDPDAGPIAKPLQITLAAGIYLFQPTFQSDPALIVSSPGAPSTRQIDFSRHMISAPAVWLGLTTDRGWGVRTRWYTLDQNSSVIAASAPGELLSVASPLKAVQTPVFGSALASGELHIDSWDLEGTCNFERCKWCLLLGGGMRYVHLDQTYGASVVSLAGAQTLATAQHNLNGFGPTFSLQGYRPLGASCFALYGIGHTSVVFGSASDSFTGIAPGATAQSISRHEVSVLPIGELEIGLEASHCWRHCRLFFQTGFVGQVWWGGGSASGFDAVNNAAASNSNFGFIGLALRAGVAF
jgi:hypothetical protein